MPLLLNRSTISPRVLLGGTTLAVLITFALLLRSNSSGPFGFRRREFTQIRSIPDSKIVKRIDGFNVIDNVLAHNGSLYIINLNKELEGQLSTVVTGNDPKTNTQNSRVTLLDREQAEDLVERICAGEIGGGGKYCHGHEDKGVALDVKPFDGMTLYLADDPDVMHEWTYMFHYYHFVAEDILGGYRSGFSTLSQDRAESIVTGRGKESLFDHVIIPYEWHWKDDKGLNEATIRKGLGVDHLIERDEWRDMNLDEAPWMLLERVVLVDRHAAHHNRTAQPQVWNKMALAALTTEISTVDPTLFWAEPRRNMIKYLGAKTQLFRPAQGKALKQDVIKIVYVNRQGTSRRLPDEDHEYLVNHLKELEMKTRRNSKKIVAQVLKFEDIEVEDQIRAVLDADILIGVHGNGMTHSVWMPPDGTVIELFIPHTFLRDFQVIADALGHHHIATWGDHEYAPHVWVQSPGQMNPSILHDGTPIPLQPAFITQLLKGLIEGMLPGTL